MLPVPASYNSAMRDNPAILVSLRVLVLVFLLRALSVNAEKSHDFQDEILSIAPTAEDAVLPISAWARDPNSPVFAVVVGTGFLINRDGYFITAAHVANVKQVAGVDVRLTATIRQKSGDGAGQAFTIIEVDTDHDLALCKIEGFKVYSPADSPTAKSMRAEAAKPLPPGTIRVDATRPFASLKIAIMPPTTGKFVVVSGFPLFSWTPTIQVGLVSATQTRYPPPAPPVGVPKDTHDLLQISVNANHGNSGGPIIDLATGEVIGVLLQLVPAPLVISGQVHYDTGTFEMSGLMLAAPAAWVNALLSKNNVQSEGIRSGKFVIW